MKAEMNQDMMGEAMDMGEDNAEADDIYEGILGEIGLEMDQASG